MASSRERRPPGCGSARRDDVPPLPPVFAVGLAAGRVAERGLGGRWQGRATSACAVGVQGSVCVRARVCGCVRAPGEAVEAAAPWLRAGRGGIARFSPAGAGDLQAIPLYFRRELTSPAPPPQETPLTAAPSPPVSRRRPSSAIPTPSLSP